MTRFAIVDDAGNVVDLLVSETQEIAEAASGKKAIEDVYAEVGIGSSWNGSKFFNPDRVLKPGQVPPVGWGEGPTLLDYSKLNPHANKTVKTL